MSVVPGAGSSAPPPGKRKEIYKYEAPWTVYSMNWSIRPDKRFRLALGSFVEEYNNKVKSAILIVYFLIYNTILLVQKYKCRSKLFSSLEKIGEVCRRIRKDMFT